MSEINGPNFSVNKVNFNSTFKSQPEILPEEQADENVQLSDFSNPKAEALGRSMLFKGADNMNNDLKALIENPQIAENSDELFETALIAAEEAGVENPYEVAASFSTSGQV